MNCLTDIECEYHTKHGLIEKIIILSINNDDCFINILRSNSLIRTRIANIRFLIRPHQPVQDVKSLKIKDELLLAEETFCTFVTLDKIYDDGTVDVLIKSNILVDGEQVIHTDLSKLSICGEYMNLNGLHILNISIDVCYSRYLNNISIFKPLLSRVDNVVIIWDAEESTIHLRAVEECCLKRIELLIPVFVHELSVLISGETRGRMETVARHIVWEYQYEDEEEANFAIGVKGANIVAVRNMPGIAGAVLTKANRLRIIAENKHVLKYARSLLEIKRESYLFEDSLVPMLVGKSASHITDLISKTALHCIHLPNSASNGVICERPLIVDTAMMGKRQLLLFGTTESINSARLLLEMEESVKDLQRELECQKITQISSSTSSVSKECEKVTDCGRHADDEGDVDGDRGKSPMRGEHMKGGYSGPVTLSWADTPLDDSDEEQGLRSTLVGDGEGGPLSGEAAVHQGSKGGTGHRNSGGMNHVRKQMKLSNQYHQGGGLVFTNSALSSSASPDPGSQGRARPNSGRQNWGPHNSNHNHNYYHQHHQQYQQQHQSSRHHKYITGDDDDPSSVYNHTCAQY